MHAPITIKSSACYNDTFREIATSLDSFNDRRERVVKASRDTTRDSKKAIFGLHRYTHATRAETLSTGAEALAKIREHIAAKTASELDADLYADLHRACSPGLQEYVEAAVFHAYLRDGTLISQRALSEELAEVCRTSPDVEFEMHVDEGDYVLGVADATGELMRLAITAAGRGDLDACLAVRVFLNCMVLAFEGIKLTGRAAKDLRFKMGVMQASNTKVEVACFDLCMRRAEFGDATVMPPPVASGGAAANGGGGDAGVKRARLD